MRIYIKLLQLTQTILSYAVKLNLDRKISLNIPATIVEYDPNQVYSLQNLSARVFIQSLEGGGGGGGKIETHVLCCQRNGQ